MVFMDLENELTSVLPGVEVAAAAANYIFEWIHWMEEGEVGEFSLEVPEGWSLHDLSTLAFFVANDEHQLAKDLIQSVPPSPMRMKTSSTLLQGEYSNDNYLKTNPFRRRRTRKLKREEGSKQMQYGAENLGSDVVMAVGGDQHSQVLPVKLDCHHHHHHYHYHHHHRHHHHHHHYNYVKMQQHLSYPVDLNFLTYTHTRASSPSLKSLSPFMTFTNHPYLVMMFSFSAGGRDPHLYP